MRMRKGFTLIELLIVLAIIAALMAVVTPIALNAVKRARLTRIAENIRNIKAAVESYVYTENTLPSDLSTFGIGDLEDAGYLSNADLSDYGLAAVDQGDGSVKFFVYYKGEDVTAEDLADILPGVETAQEAGFTTLDDNDDDTDPDTGIPGLVFEIEKWW